MKHGDPLIELNDAATRRNLVEAQRSLRSAENDRDRYELLLELQALELQEGLAQKKAAWEEAREEAEMKQELVGPGYISVLERPACADAGQSKLGTARTAARAR